MQIARKVTVPEELKRRVPNTNMEFVERRVMIRLFMLGIACVGLSTWRNGWLYFVAASVAPMSAALFYVFFPFNPYRSRYAKYDNMKNLDRRNSVARHLVNLLRSREARLVLLRTGVFNAAFLTLAMSVIAAIQAVLQKPLNWSFDAKMFLAVTFVCGALCLRIYEDALLYWAFRNWTRPTEEPHQQNPAQDSELA